jgi:hypothetical protein
MSEPELKIMPVTPCGFVGKCQSHPSGYESYCTSRYTYTKPSQERIAAHALQELEAARAKDVATHEGNLAAIENNKAVRARVEQLMTGIGMPLKWSDRDRNSRSRYPKTVTHDAGWKTDLWREVPIDDGFALATQTYQSLKARYDEYAESAKGAAAREQAQREAAEKARIEKRKADMALAAILLRYSLPPESEWSDVLDALRARDQRLDLAVAMAQTRGDWSEGAYRVWDALHRFTINTDEDKDIAADVTPLLADFDDGRCFRDCAWNYSRIFDSVADKQLSADVQLAMQHVSND